MPINEQNQFLLQKHPIYDRWKDIWLRNERRIRGGDHVLSELQQFDWELATGAHYLARQQMATYVNFPDMFATTMIGHLLRKAPRVDDGALSFGRLGEVRTTRSTKPTRAEMIYYNADGVGNNDSQWDNFWGNSTKWAMGTGHRWIMVETPRTPEGVALTQQDELEGKRPYLVSLSPLSVPNWHFDRDGRLAWMVVAHLDRQPQVLHGKFQGNVETTRYVLLVRKGITTLGAEYASGGWWEFDSELNQVAGATGDWSRTGGVIPSFPHFYERDHGEANPSLLPSEAVEVVNNVSGFPAMSRPGLTELGNAAVSYMNLSSAADFDAWDAAISVQFLLGVDESGFNLAMAKFAKGSRFIPVPVNRETEGIPSVHDSSTGTVVADVFDKRLASKRAEVSRQAVMESDTGTTAPSGISQQAEFSGAKAPRLALMASELEQAQNAAIYFLELRWGFAEPEGFAQWTRDFSLVDVLDSVNNFLALQKLAGVSSKTLTAKSLVLAARARDLINSDEEAELIRKEYEESSDKLDLLAQAENQLTPDGAGETGEDHGVGGDGTGAVPGARRLEKSAK